MNKKIFFFFILFLTLFAQDKRTKFLDPASTIINYIPSRIVDFFDIFYGSIEIGPSLGFQLSLTQNAQLGVMASYPFFRVAFENRGVNVKSQMGFYYSHIVGSEDSRVLNDTKKISHIMIDNEVKHEFRLTLGFGAGTLSLGIRPDEIWDFVAGFLLLDPKQDNFLPPFTQTFDDTGISGSRPIDKLSRGLYNITFGWWDAVSTILDVNESEGSIKAIFYGIPSGIGRAIARTVVGGVEILTCWLGGKPVVLPEYPFNFEDFPFSLGDTDWSFHW